MRGVAINPFDFTDFACMQHRIDLCMSKLVPASPPAQRTVRIGMAGFRHSWQPPLRSSGARAAASDAARVHHHPHAATLQQCHVTKRSTTTECVLLFATSVRHQVFATEHCSSWMRRRWVPTRHTDSFCNAQLAADAEDLHKQHLEVCKCPWTRTMEEGGRCLRNLARTTPTLPCARMTCANIRFGIRLRHLHISV